MAFEAAVRRTGLALALGWAVFVVPVGAAEIRSLRPGVTDGWLSFTLSADDLLDARTTSTIESGLPGNCIYRVSLVDATGKPSEDRFYNFTLRFDVWEELYRLDGPGGERVFGSLAAADSAWAHPADLKLVPLSHLNGGEEYRLRVEVSVRSIAMADRLRLAEFVSRSSAAGRQELHVDVGALFTRLSGKVEAEGAARFESPRFRPASLVAQELP
jgi:hypothetical protein